MLTRIFKGADAFDGDRSQVGPWKRSVRDACLGKGILSYLEDGYASIRPVMVTKELKAKARQAEEAAKLTTGESQLLSTYRKQQNDEKKAAEQIQAIILESITATVRNDLKDLEAMKGKTPLSKARVMFEMILNIYQVDDLANDADVELRMNSVPQAKDLPGTIAMIKLINDLHCLMHENAREHATEKRSILQMKLLIISKLPRNEFTKEFEANWMLLIQKLDMETQETWRWLDLYKYLMEYLKQQESYMSLARSGSLAGGMKMQAEKEDSTKKHMVQYMTGRESLHMVDLMERMEKTTDDFQRSMEQYQVNFIKDGRSKQICHRFANIGNCRYGNDCRFVHGEGGKSYAQSLRDTGREGETGGKSYAQSPRETGREGGYNQGRTTSSVGVQSSRYQQDDYEDSRRSPSPKRSDGKRDRDERDRSRSPVRDDRKRANSPYPRRQMGSENQRVRY